VFITTAWPWDRRNLRDRQPLPPLPGRTLRHATAKVARKRHPTPGGNVVVARRQRARAISVIEHRIGAGSVAA